MGYAAPGGGRMNKEELQECMKKALPRCPICHSSSGYEISGIGKDYLHCVKCRSKWYLRPKGDWFGSKLDKGIVTHMRLEKAPAQRKELESKTHPFEYWQSLAQEGKGIAPEPAKHKPNVAKLAAEGDVEGLIEALKHEDGAVRKKAAKAIGKTKDGRAVEPLVRALYDKDGDVGEAATEALAEMKDERAVELLLQALNDKNKDTRLKAGYCLGRMGDMRVVGPLIQALKDKDDLVRHEIAEGFAFLAGMGDPVIMPLVGALKDEDWRARSEAAWILGTTGDARAVEPLIEALQDGNSTVRAQAAWALGGIGDVRAVDPITTHALKDKDKDVRGAGQDALEEIEKKSGARKRPREAVAAGKRGEAMEYFECDVPAGDGRCSDDNCPCPEVVIPRGTGYLYIDQELVDFRRRCPTMKSVAEAMERLQEQMRASGVGLTGFYRAGPILVCEQGARLRKLDLEVAAADAKYWWETGKVPLRVTPLRRSSKRKAEEAGANKCERCNKETLSTKDYVKKVKQEGWTVHPLTQKPQPPPGFAGGVSKLVKLENRRGFRCKGCKRVYCMDCLFNHAPAHPNGGKACFKCGSSLEAL